MDDLDFEPSEGDELQPYPHLLNRNDIQSRFLHVDVLQRETETRKKIDAHPASDPDIHSQSTRYGRLDLRLKGFHIEQESQDAYDDSKRDDARCYEQDLF